MRSSGVKENEIMSEVPTLVAALSALIQPKDSPVALHEPEFMGQEWAYIKRCLDTGWVSASGEFVDRFEQDLATRCETTHALVTMNGTAALHAALVGFGIGGNDEVLVPSLTFVATANAVSYTHATLHFVDSDPNRLGICPDKLKEYLEQITEVVGSGKYGPTVRNKTTKRVIKAILVTHVFGHPVDMDKVLEIASQFGLIVIEDAAEGLGSLYRGRPLGSIGHAGILSFNGNKIITTGGGGAIVTNDDAFASQIRHLCTTAKRPHPWEYEHDMIGYNYRLPNINAALGCAQLERLDNFLDRKRQLSMQYKAALEKLTSLDFVEEPDDSLSNYWLNAIKFHRPLSGQERRKVLETLHHEGLLCRPVWSLMHRLPMYEHCPRMDMAICEDLVARIVNIPSSANLVAA